MKKIAFALAMTGLAACGANNNSSNSLVAAETASTVKVDGPNNLKFDEHTFIQDQGQALTVDIDKHSARGCRPVVAYKTSKLSSTEYLVQIIPAYTTFMACLPHMLTHIQYGTKIEIPEDKVSNLVRIYVQRKSDDSVTKVEIKKAVDGTGVSDRVESAAFVEYRISQAEGKAFSVEVDYNKINACYKNVGHFAQALEGEDYFVNIKPLMVPAVVCRPGMEREIQTGVKIDVPATDSYNFARILVKKGMGLPREVKAELQVSAQD